ncbi:MAG: hypothetical protein ABIK09_20940 [Pseudomonadota bacterium]
MRYLPLILILVVAACSTGTDAVTPDAAPPGEDASIDTGLSLDTTTLEIDSQSDQFELDLSAPETTPDLEVSELVEDTGVPCEPGEGCFLEPCAENSDCHSGWCVQHMGEEVCTRPCTDDCPGGWSCEQVGGGDPGVVFICISELANLCRPCGAAGDCEDLGGAEDVCVAYGPEAGAFCGGACEEDGDCPDGYSCADVVTIDGFETRQCVNDLGECPCTNTSVELVLWTPCVLENDIGHCAGKRLCTEDGLSSCDAAEPSAEVCNGVDDDCDGLLDEETCDDGNPCTDDVCLGETGCEHVALEGDDCADGDPCTAADHCVAGICVGEPILCDDQNPCTDDSCTETGDCAHVPNVLACDDGDPCTVADECGEGVCAGTPAACDCAQDEDCLPLEDGDVCNGTLICGSDAVPLQCVVDPETLVECPAPEGTDAPCLVTTCDAVTGDCGLAPGSDSAPCDDGDPCTIADSCGGGACLPGETANCTDGNPCTDDGCDTDAGCTHTPNTLPCDDGSGCTVDDGCQDGVCVGEGDLVCDDDNGCTDDSCEPLSGCVYTPNIAPCDDGNACTAADACADSACMAGAPMDCDDEDACTADSCEPPSGCVFTPNANPCDDGNLCTDDSCEPASGCVFAPNEAPCDDGDLCTVGDHCSEGSCVVTGTMDCNDWNHCTDDACDPLDGSCANTPNTALCDDGDGCTVVDQCAGGSCVGTVTPDCDDQNPCTDDICEPDNGCVSSPNNASCDDGDVCTLDDICELGACAPGPSMDCSGTPPCPSDAALGCVCVPGSEGGACVPACNTDDDCPELPDVQLICLPEGICGESDEEPFCGDAICDPTETFDSCPEDCEDPDPPVCGDDVCEAPEENPNSCPEDCDNPFCGDGFCTPPENPQTCPNDCDGPDPEGCTSDSDCEGSPPCPPPSDAPEGCVCVSGPDVNFCIPACLTAFDCPSPPGVEFICTPEGICAPDDGGPQEGCDDDADCQGNPPCPPPSDAPLGCTCITGPGAGFCAPTCLTDDDCPSPPGGVMTCNNEGYCFH